MLKRIRFEMLSALLIACSIGCDQRVESTPSVDPNVVADLRQVKTPTPKSPQFGTGWGTLAGTFRFQGEPPKMEPFNLDKDPLCAMPVENESLVVDPATRGLANVLIYARKVPQVHPDYVNGPGREVTLMMNHCRFEPHVVASSLNDRFVLLNLDRTAHNSQGSPPSGNKTYSEQIAPRQGRYEYGKFKKAFTTPYSFSCAIHPWMKAYHIVRPDPYFAVTAKDGTFKIERLPTGVKLDFQVWHEKGAGENGGLRAKSSWNKDGRFEVTIPKDGDTVTLDVDVEAQHFHP